MKMSISDSITSTSSLQLTWFTIEFDRQEYTYSRSVERERDLFRGI